jgi:nitrite reductase/ring-hydroxylating ferredoxin subunit
VANTTITVRGALRLADKQTAKFTYTTDAGEREGFVIRLGERVYAYKNQCRHIPMTMDWVENRFLSRDGCYIQCATHGARYEIASGLCVDGPPTGERLIALAVEIDGEDAIVTLPESNND